MERSTEIGAFLKVQPKGWTFFCLLILVMKINEEVYIGLPGDLTTFYLMEKGSDAQVGCLKSKTRYAAILLNEKLQKAGFDCGLSKPECTAKCMQYNCYNLGEIATLAVPSWFDASSLVAAVADILKIDWQKVTPASMLFQNFKLDSSIEKDFLTTKNSYCLKENNKMKKNRRAFYESEYDDYPEQDTVGMSLVRRSNLREAVKKTSLNALIAEIMKGQPPKPIKRPGDAAKWFKDLAKDNSFVTEQVCGFIKSRKLDLAIDFLENIKYMSTITESEATRLVKKYGKGETKKYPLANEVKESRYLGEKFLNEGDVVIEILQDDGKWYPVGTTREGWSISKDVKVRVFESLAEAKKSALRRALDNDGYHEDLGNLRFTKKDDGLENL